MGYGHENTSAVRDLAEVLRRARKADVMTTSPSTASPAEPDLLLRGPSDPPPDGTRRVVRASVS